MNCIIIFKNKSFSEEAFNTLIDHIKNRFGTNTNINNNNNSNISEQVNKSENIPNSSQTINIYAGANENTHLSNFAERPFVYKGREYQSVEQAFQYIKGEKFSNTNNIATGNEDILREIISSKDPAEIKKLGRQLKEVNVKDWDKHSERIMKELIRESFKQNPEALNSLLSTGNATLTHTQDTGKWKTLFPKILMEVRDELKSFQNNNNNNQNNKQNTPQSNSELKKQEILNKLRAFEQNMEKLVQAGFQFQSVSNLVNGDDFIPNKNTYHGTIIGNKVDHIVREFFAGNKIPFENQSLTDNISDYQNLMKNLENLLNLFNTRGEIPYTEEFYIYNLNYDGKGTNLRGKTDLITIDKEGVVRVYDIKSLTPKGLTNYRTNYYEKHQDQISAYSIMLYNSGFKVADGGIIQISVNRTVPDNESIIDRTSVTENTGVPYQTYEQNFKANPEKGSITYYGDYFPIPTTKSVKNLTLNENKHFDSIGSFGKYSAEKIEELKKQKDIQNLPKLC